MFTEAGMNFEPVIQRPKNNFDTKTTAKQCEKPSDYSPSVVGLRQDNMEESTDTGRDRPQNESKSRTEELRLVLFGHGWLQKSLTGNTLLRQQMFDTGRDVKMCVRRQTLSRDGKRMIVVNTPDRWLQYHVHDPSLMNDNMAECLSMCHPGPHAFLMVVPLGLSKGREWTVEGPLSLLNDHVWERTIVVFTRPEKLNGIMVEDHIIERPFLKPLLERCGHRYHLIDTSFYGHESQVQGLLERIGAMVEENTQDWVSTDVEAFVTEPNREEVEVRAKVRQSDARATKSVLRSLIETHAPAKELHILVIGQKQVGKSSTCKTLLGQAPVHSKKITAVDTPGWHGRYYSHKTPSETLQQIRQSFKNAEPDAVLLVLRGDETFTESDCLKVEEHVGLLGASVWSKTIVLFTFKDKLGSTAIEEHIERWPALQRVVDKCANRFHTLNNLDKVDPIQVVELLEKIEELDVFNDNQYLLQCYMKVQERYRKTVENCKAMEIQLDTQQGENQELRKNVVEKDCLAQSLTDAICIHEKSVDEVNGELRRTAALLEEAEKDKNRLKKCLKEKDRLISRLSSEKAEAQQSIDVEREMIDTKLREMLELRGHTEAEVMKLQEEKKRLKTENECTKMMLHSVVTEVQKQFKKKLNLQRKMAADVSTSEMLFRLENDEDDLSIQSSAVEKKPQSDLSSGWVLAAGAALGAALGSALGGWRMDGFRLNLSSAAGAAAATLLGVCWGSAGGLLGVCRLGQV